ncbi:hypothetical protein [Brevundimonas olei]|uniref:hypothetical protein n=1 Tax=Brevundimonas olei TaxID=657642 RepID=UPI0031DEEC66
MEIKAFGLAGLMLLSAKCSSIINLDEGDRAFDLLNTMSKRALDKARCLEDEARELHRRSRSVTTLVALLPTVSVARDLKAGRLVDIFPDWRPVNGSCMQSSRHGVGCCLRCGCFWTSSLRGARNSNCW